MKYLRSLLFPILLSLGAAAFAGPGAHGPGGEHLDDPGSAPASAAGPRLETHSESFELVARLESGTMSVLVDRFETNEPVLGAELEIEAAGRNAKARFDRDRGHYTVDDEGLLGALAQPGQHAVLFTLVAGDESDLLEGTWAVAEAAHGAPPARDWRLLAGTAAAVIALVLLAAIVLRRRRLPRAAVGVAVLLAGVALLPPVQAGPGAHGPGGEHLDEAPAAAPASGLARLPDGSVNVPKMAQRRMEVRTMLAPESEAAATVELPGRIVMDPNAGGRVQPTHGGRIEPGPRGLPIAGQAVRKGEVLAYLRHHAEPYAVASQRSQLAELSAARSTAEQRVARLESLEGTVPRKDIEAARTELMSLVQREGSIAGGIQAREPLLAPVSGVIARADAVSGQVVEARDVLFEIVDPRRVLVEAAVADAALGARLGAARLREAPDLELRLAGVAGSLRDGLLPITFRATARNAASPIAVAVGQPVTVIASLKEKVRGIVLPAASVVRNGTNEPVVWIKVSAERFMPMPVEVRALDAQTVLVVRGLAADNRVVVQGASLIAQIR